MDEGTKLAAKVGGVAHRSVPITDDCLRDQGGKIIVVFPAHTFNCDGNVCCWASVVSHSDLGTDEVRCLLLSGSTRGSCSGWWFHRDVGEVLLRKFHQLLVRYTTSADQDHTISSIIFRDIADQIVPLNARNVFFWPQNGAP